MYTMVVDTPHLDLLLCNTTLRLLLAPHKVVLGYSCLHGCDYAVNVVCCTDVLWRISHRLLGWLLYFSIILQISNKSPHEKDV